VRRRIKSVELSPEQSGLCGCWRFIAVERVTIDLTKPSQQQTPETEIAYYASSHIVKERSDAQLLDLIVGHWGAIENGVHRVRDVTFGEDACRVGCPTRVDIENRKNGKRSTGLEARRKAARNLVTLRNLAIALYALQLDKKKTKAPSLASWRRSMPASKALRMILN